jgi:hypothetical protein
MDGSIIVQVTGQVIQCLSICLQEVVGLDLAFDGSLHASVVDLQVHAELFRGFEHGQTG